MDGGLNVDGAVPQGHDQVIHAKVGHGLEPRPRLWKGGDHDIQVRFDRCALVV